MKHHNENLTRELEIINGINKTNENSLKDRIEAINLEKERLLEKLSKKKLKYKQKIQTLKAAIDKQGEEALRGNAHRVRQLETQLKDYEHEVNRLTIAERNSLEKVRELELRLSRDDQDKDEKINQHFKNIENERRTLRNDIEVKTHMLKVASEEKAALQNKAAQLEKAYAVLESKYFEIEKENKLLIEEVVAFRKELPNLRQFSQNIQRSKVFEHIID